MQSTWSRRKFLGLSLTGISIAGVLVFLRKTSGLFDPFSDKDYEEILKKSIRGAYRLTDERSLLNLEFYFVNCYYKKGKVWAKYGPHENYMIVRLPQQHMAEQVFDQDKVKDGAAEPWKATAYISGFSYLVFRILFPADGWIKSMFTGQDGEFSSIDLQKEELLDWNSNKFRLVVRQDLTKPLFQLQENQVSNAAEPWNNTPSFYGDPVTAIELPWRLIISPNLPDSSKYKFLWEFTGIEEVKDKNKSSDNHLLWTATLRITERSDDDYIGKIDAAVRSKAETGKVKTKIVADTLRELELMIIGVKSFARADSAFVAKNFLPNAADRKQLLDLYLKLRVMAHTDKITFSPFGASVNIHLKNTLLEKAFEKGISLVEWEQLISFGRDEKIELATLFLEREFGHKMLYVRTAQRRLINGSYALIRVDYIQPLDVIKDYSDHITQPLPDENAKKQQTISRFASPFKKITFLETLPKEVHGLDPQTPGSTNVKFQFEAVDWQDYTVKFNKTINMLPLGAVMRDDTDEAVKKIVQNTSGERDITVPTDKKLTIQNVDDILKKFPPEKTYSASQTIDLLLSELGKINDNIKTSLASAFPEIVDVDLEELQQRIDILLKEIQKELSLVDFDDPTKVFGKMIDRWVEKQFSKNDRFLEAVGKIRTVPDWLEGKKIVLDKFYAWLHKLSDSADNSYLLLAAANPVLAKDVMDTVKMIGGFAKSGPKLLLQLKDKWAHLIKVVEKAKDIPNLILLEKQRIAYAIEERLDNERQEVQARLKDISGEVKESLSHLETEYISFEGKLRRDEAGVFAFFHDYAILPQVKQAKVYVSTLNKLIGEELPVSIEYAKEYVDNQITNTLFEYERNGSMVFCRITDQTREELKGVMQRISSKMPGFNIEIPAHYLTYLKNPKAAVTDALNELGYKYQKEIDAASRDLIFISEEAKDAVKVVEDLENMDPTMLFKDLGAKLFGSIRLEDILGIGFDLPRITKLPDKIIYQFSNSKFVEHKAALVVFRPNIQGETKLDLFISKSLRNNKEFYAYTQLNNFQIGVVIGSTEVLNVDFNQFKVISSPEVPHHTEISIGKVKLGGPLEFIADLAQKFMAPGNGMRLSVGPANIALDYTIALPNIEGAAFHFRNLQLVVGLNIPYDPHRLEPISVKFGVNKPDDKFLVAAGIYGGRGHFQIQATPKGIENIDIALELGAYGVINLGIGQGEVFLFFGFWFMCGHDPGTGQKTVKAVAYVICSGSATVLGFISIGVSVLIALTYEKRGEAATFSGDAVVTYSVKIAFFKKEFSIHYHKEIAGSSQGSGTRAPAMIRLGAIGMGGLSTESRQKQDRFKMSDVFADEGDLKEYLNCFI